MRADRSVKTVIALVLASAMVPAAAQVTGQSARATTGHQGTPSAVPPFLGPPRRSELAAIRQHQLEAQHAFSYRLPAGARYSTAEMGVFAAEGYGGA